MRGLTGLTISGSSTAPSEAELSTFLNDGVIDVTSRWLVIRPQDIDQFTRESITTASNGFDTTGAQIIAVIREAGADGDTDGSTVWEPCRKVPVQMQSRVVNEESLSYASKYNPVYIIDSNGLLNVYPVPDGTDDGYRVFYVNNSPEETDGSALDHASTGIKWFPNDKVYLVVLYASMRSVQAKMADTTISDLSITAAPPDVPTLSSVTFSSVDTDLDASLPTFTTATVSAGGVYGASTAPTYTKPTVGGTADELTDMTALDSENTIDDFDGNAIEVDQWFATAAHLIEGEEDAELATIQLQKISTYISAYQTEVQNELNEFNKENASFQANMGEAMQELQVANQVNIAKAQAELQKNIDNENRSQQRQFQNSINDMKAIVDDNQQSIGKYSAELQEYQAQVGSEVQEYTQNLQSDGVGYQWLQDQYARLKAEYDQAFMIAAPKPQQQAAR